MKEIFTSYILPSGIILTFIGTCFTIYFTRRNLKTSKYIDTITSERIKWLSIIRTDISEFIAIVTQTLILYTEEIENLESQNPNEEYINDVNYKYHLHYFDSRTMNSFSFSSKVNYGDIIKKLYILKLRFNPIEDSQTLSILNYFINFYKSEYKSRGDIKEAYLKIDSLVQSIQSILKNEWEKVKKESIGKTSKPLR